LNHPHSSIVDCQVLRNMTRLAHTWYSFIVLSSNGLLHCSSAAA
jgi:hypothetical protein